MRVRRRAAGAATVLGLMLGFTPGYAQTATSSAAGPGAGPRLAPALQDSAEASAEDAAEMLPDERPDHPDYPTKAPPDQRPDHPDYPTKAPPDERPYDPEAPAEVPPDERPYDPILSPERVRAPIPYRNPQGTFSAGALLGLASGSGGSSLVLGVGLGYAVLTGVMPGVRGVVAFGQGIGGELVGTVTLTPPIAWSVTPFGVVEGGRRWVSGLDGWLYGLGAGVYLGDPSSKLSFQFGWIWRWFKISGGDTIQVHAPIIGVSLRF